MKTCRNMYVVPVVLLCCLLLFSCATVPASGWGAQRVDVLIQETPNAISVLGSVDPLSTASEAERACVMWGATLGATSLDATASVSVLTEDVRARIAAAAMLAFMKKACPVCLEKKTAFQMIRDVLGVKQELSDAETVMLAILSMRAKLHTVGVAAPKAQ